MVQRRTAPAAESSEVNLSQGSKDGLGLDVLQDLTIRRPGQTHSRQVRPKLVAFEIDLGTAPRYHSGIEAHKTLHLALCIAGMFAVAVGGRLHVGLLGY